MEDTIRPQKAKVERTEEFARAKRTLMWYSAAAIIVALSPDTSEPLSTLWASLIDKEVLLGMLSLACLYYGLHWLAETWEQGVLVWHYKQSVEGQELRSIHEGLVGASSRLIEPFEEFELRLSHLQKDGVNGVVGAMRQDVAVAFNDQFVTFVFFADKLAEHARHLEALSRRKYETIDPKEVAERQEAYDTAAVSAAKDILANRTELLDISSGLQAEQTRLERFFDKDKLDQFFLSSLDQRFNPEIEGIKASIKGIEARISELEGPLQSFNKIEKKLSFFDRPRLVALDVIIPIVMLGVAVWLSWHQVSPLFDQAFLPRTASHDQS